ncbi:MAG: basic secretory protein-like protein [Pirellula sp.]
MHLLNRMTLCVMITATTALQSVEADELISLKYGEVVVNLDVNQVPELKDWGIKAANLALEWHPRICNLISTKGVAPANELSIRLIESEEGIASTQGTVITISSRWIKNHPDDLGLVIHELAHVIQGYPEGNPWWVTEGIADYVRNVVFEGKSQQLFAVPLDEKGYLQGYNTAAGFLFWLESDLAPGIVRRLNTSIRNRKYSDVVFKELTGQSLDELWDTYCQENITKR